MVGAAPGEGGWQEERIWCIICEGRASAKGCFTAGCGRVCIKKVATIGTFNKHLMGSIHALCVLVCALGGCAGLPCLQLHLSLGVIQPVPVAQFCQEMLQCCNVQGKRNHEHSPSLSARGTLREFFRILVGHLFSCFNVEQSCSAYPAWQPLLLMNVVSLWTLRPGNNTCA